MRLVTLLLLFCCACSGYSSGLPPEHESARLLLVIEEAVENKNWVLADENLSKMADLKVDLPVPFFFYNGWVHFKQARYEKAQHSLEHYVVKAGPSASFYYDALRLLTSVEAELGRSKDKVKGDLTQVDVDMQANESEVNPSILVHKDRDAYVQSLKALYLTDNPVQALVMQINSLLSAHSYTGSRVKKISEKQGVKFQISIQDSLIVLQETNYQDGFPQLSAKRFGLNGVDPFIRFECSGREIACWLFHPASAHERWLYFDNDQLVASELSQAFTRLIQILQQK